MKEDIKALMFVFLGQNKQRKKVTGIYLKLPNQTNFPLY